MNTNSTLEEITRKIEASLDTIRPYLKADGGDVKVSHISDDHVVRLEFIGACGNCSMSSMTFKAGVEAAIKRDVPEVRSIEVVNLTPIGR
ncbi:NifU family protein [Fulvivirgaceae bacterium PWU4]|uniref:NifU family protein n=1 Tax=Chryseosolibacter histidini TaxID=2782349 RepID=A0AAP2GJG7_9BACT|nr:NifU family protein [Chryseosolibacter histidini]MBT1698346.1 NifU family protein [Chryseosolibacter histidini]